MENPTDITPASQAMSPSFDDGVLLPSAHTPEGSTSQIIPPRDDQYYFDFVVFLVGDCLFKVPRHKFESESPVFLSMFDLPASSNPDGLSDDQPLRLEGVDQQDFRNLLKYLYPRDMNVNLTIDEWQSVLKLATMWDMEYVRNDSITRLASLVTNPAQKVGIAIDYDIEPWLVPALNQLVQRADPISLADLAYLGIDCGLKVAAIREACQRGNTTCYYCSNSNYINLQPSRGQVTVDCEARIRSDFEDLLSPAGLRCDKMDTADVMKCEEETTPRLSKKKRMKARKM